MNVSLTPELEALVQDKVASGRYASASEVVRDALRLLEQRDRTEAEKLAWLRKAWQEGLDSGPGGTIDDVEAIIAEARAEYDAMTAKKRRLGYGSIVGPRASGPQGYLALHRR